MRRCQGFVSDRRCQVTTSRGRGGSARRTGTTSHRGGWGYRFIFIFQISMFSFLQFKCIRRDKLGSRGYKRTGVATRQSPPCPLRFAPTASPVRALRSPRPCCGQGLRFRKKFENPKICRKYEGFFSPVKSLIFPMHISAFFFPRKISENPPWAGGAPSVLGEELARVLLPFLSPALSQFGF